MRRQNFRQMIYLIMMFLLVAGCATAPARPTTLLPGDYGYLKEYMSWFVQNQMKKNDVIGLSVALVDDQQVIWSEGFGFADKRAGMPAGADTIYRVGSISKLFTTMAALQLSEQGKLELDKPLSAYIPDFTIRSRYPGAKPITPRSIMTHHSGIPSDRHQGMWTKKPVPIADLPSLISDDYAAFPPDTVFSYSNLGMSLLGLAVQNASGQEFASQMRQAILTPLRMESAVFSAGAAAVLP
ncbi:MAG: serine hydrolase, partial [Desulfobulbaceae bacterium]|nr:serine hydrolase [Desulfobulbaceae bacterium]